MLLSKSQHLGRCLSDFNRLEWAQLLLDQQSMKLKGEQTFVMVKPDGVKRGLIGPIITSFEQKGFELAAISLRTIDRKLAETHYGELMSKPFFGELVEFTQRLATGKEK